MKKKEVLDYTYNLAKEIKSSRDIVEEMQRNLLTIKGIRYDLERVQGGKQEADGGLTNKIFKIEEEREKLADRLERLIDYHAKIGLAIEELQDPIQKAVLRYKYIMGYTWEMTAEAVGYSTRHTRRIGEEAVDALVLEEEWFKCP